MQLQCPAAGALHAALYRAFEHTWLSLGPVSYTHLDVYKRQGQYCTLHVTAGQRTDRPQRVRRTHVELLNQRRSLGLNLSLIHI